MTRCKTRQQKQFEYRSILSSLFFQRVLATQPYVALSLVTFRDPSMKKWLEVLSHLGGRRQSHFSCEFFDHFNHQIRAIDHYGYARNDFHEETEFVLPEGEYWDHKIGMKDV